MNDVKQLLEDFVNQDYTNYTGEACGSFENGCCPWDDPIEENDW